MYTVETRILQNIPQAGTLVIYPEISHHSSQSSAVFQTPITSLCLQAWCTHDARAVA